MKGLDDAEDGLNERAFDAVLCARRRAPSAPRDAVWVAELIRRTVAASRTERR